MDKLRQELSSLHVEKALDIATRDGAFAKEMYAGFGSCKEIVALGKENPDILVVDIDIGKSCKTGEFRKELPDQYINVGIAEQNGAGVAAGKRKKARDNA